MRKLTPPEVQLVPTLKKGRYTSIHMHLLQLKPGEGLEIKKGTDWIAKHPPYRLIKGFSKKTGWKLIARKSPDKTGWWVTRGE